MTIGRPHTRRIPASVLYVRQPRLRNPAQVERTHAHQLDAPVRGIPSTRLWLPGLAVDLRRRTSSRILSEKKAFAAVTALLVDNVDSCGLTCHSCGRKAARLVSYAYRYYR